MTDTRRMLVYVVFVCLLWAAGPPAASAQSCPPNHSPDPTCEDSCLTGCRNDKNGKCQIATGAPCDDGDLCTTNTVCSEEAACEGGEPVVCEAVDQCHLAGECDPGTGECSNPEKADGVECDDGAVCTGSDTCQAGVCQGAAMDDCCVSDDECNEASACKDAGFCDLETNTCVSGSDVDCDGGDPCMVYTCTEPDGCTSSPRCLDDGNPCTDTCVDGACNVPSTANTCDDGVICTTNQCEADGSCSAIPVPGCCQSDGDCNDESACTGVETCDVGTGECQPGNPVDCDDDWACTDDVCDPADGSCSHTLPGTMDDPPNGLVCNVETLLRGLGQ